MNRLWISGLAAALIAGAPFIPHTQSTAHALCDPSPPGLVSSWQAEGDYTDCNGINNGTQVGSVPFAPGKIGQAFSYTTNPNNYVDLGNPASLKFSDAVTIAAWIYPTAPPDPSNLRSILVKWGQRFTPPVALEDAYGLWTENGSGGNLRIFGAVNLDPGSGGANEPHADGGAIPLNAWSHVAMTFDRAAPGNNLIVYVNCSAVASAAGGDHPIIQSDKRVLIGREDSPIPRPWAGLIDQVRVYNRALTAVEVAGLATQAEPHLCDVYSFSFACPPDTVVDAKGIASRIFTITNTGNVPDSYEYSVTDNSGWISPVMGTTGPVAPNETFSVKVTATGDADCNPANDALTFSVRRVGDLQPPQTCRTNLTCSPVQITKTLESDHNPSVCGEKVIFTNRLSQLDATGTVTFFDGNATIGSAPVTNGSATLSIATLTAGTHSITATYSGDGGHLPATSNKIDQVVNPIATTMTLTGDPNPSQCGQKVTVTARVNPPTATGQVNLSGDVTATATLVNGEASFSFVLGSNKSFTASYKGDACHAPSQSAKLVQVVNPIPTTTTLTCDPNPSTCGQKVTLTATVDPPAASGRVNFFDGGVLIGSGVLVNGVVTFSTTTLSVGTHSITAVYGGVGCYGTSTSNKIDQVVNPIVTTTTITGDPNPSQCGQKVTLTATVDPPAAGGQVNFFDAGVGNTPIGSGTLVNGVATLSITTLSVGVHSITAVYKGDGCYGSSTSNKVQQFVTPTPTTTTLASSPNPSQCPGNVTLTATVAPSTATGEVNFFDGALLVATGLLVNGVATVTLQDPSMGTHSYTAIYKGDGCYAGSLSDKVVHVHDCPTATLLSMFRAEPLSGAVELRWQFSDPSAFVDVHVERSANRAGPWTTVTAEIREAGGVTVAVDRTVQPGQSYWYRLVARPASGSTLEFGPLAATAGSAPQRFELGAAWPNPTPGNTHVDFAVARESNIRLSIVDVLGREVALLAQGTHGPGRYQAVWTGQTPRGLAPVGLYFVRYQFPGKVLIGRLVTAR